MADFAAIPGLPANEEDDWWGGGSSRLWHQVDCKGLADVVNGDAVLHAPRLEPIFRRTVASLFLFARQGWETRNAAAPFVIWKPREFNTAPDYLRNAAMDQTTNWQWQDHTATQQAKLPNVCLKICVDGGLRGTGPHQAATGIAVYRRSAAEPSSHHPILYKAFLLSNVDSAFQCEAMALESAMDELKLILR